MTARRLAWPALTAWVLAPLVVLVVRAVGRTWPFPELWPSSMRGGALVALVDARLLAASTTSLALAVWTGVTSSALAFAFARSLARAPRAVRTTALALALLSVVAPPVALALGLQVAMLGLGLSGTVSGVYLAHLVPATGYLTLFAAGVFSAYDFTVHDEARTLGATRWHVATRVAWPLLRPRLVEGALLGALVSWGQLALTLLVGGGLVRTLPVELLAFLRAGDDQLGAAAALVLTVPPLLGLGLVQTATRRSGATW
ncbi:MAG: ABC transporter permease [Vicinamibacterales bacterium]